jgi:phosphatidylglycerophosphatase A
VLTGLGLLRAGGTPALAIAALLATGAGIWAVRASRAGGDPGWVVIDEIAGQWIAMLPLRHSAWVPALLAFAAFRLFDIVKPGPVGCIDRREGPLAVMGDDLAAGALAAALLLVLRLLAGPWSETLPAFLAI